MCLDDIKLFAKYEKEWGNSKTGSENIQPGLKADYRDQKQYIKHKDQQNLNS